MEKKQNRKFVYIWAALTVLCMGAVFVFSSFDAEVSGAQSSFLTVFLFGNDTMELFVRKGAHFTIFAVLGFCAFNTYKYIFSGKKLFILSLCTASAYAVTDELHQYFVPGRVCQFSDWAIDTAGALFGICAAYLIWRQVKKRREK